MKQTFDRYGWLPLLVVVMIVAVGGIIMFGLSELEDTLTDRTGRDLQWAAMEIAEKLDLLLFERYGDIQILSDSFPEGGTEQREARWAQHLKRVQEAYPIYAWIGLLDKTGRVMAATDPDTIGRAAGSMARGTQLDGTPLDGTPPIMVHEIPHDDLLKEQQTVGFSIPVTIPSLSEGSNSFHGYMMTRIKLSELDAMVTRTLRDIGAKTDLRKGLEYQILTRQGLVIIESLRQERKATDLVALGLESARQVIAGRSGFVLERHLRRDISVLTGYAPMPARKELAALRWGILVRIDQDASLAPVRSVVRTV
ncbi:MAG: cache domain-containing protein, partial [Nitrospirae bacterium]|nr:cache domain-containing protein [Nitrospirota bacterium]